MVGSVMVNDHIPAVSVVVVSSSAPPVAVNVRSAAGDPSLSLMTPCTQPVDASGVHPAAYAADEAPRVGAKITQHSAKSTRKQRRNSVEPRMTDGGKAVVRITVPPVVSH